MAKDWIKKAIKHPGRCTPGSPNYDCPKGSPQWNLAQRFKHGDLHKKEQGGYAASDNIDIDYYTNPVKYFAAMGINISDDDCLECGGRIKAENGLNPKPLVPSKPQQIDFEMERQLPPGVSYERDVKKFSWNNRDTSPEQIKLDSSYMLYKTPKGYSNVYQDGKLIGYTVDNKVLIPGEPNFQNGGNVQKTIENLSYEDILTLNSLANKENLSKSKAATAVYKQNGLDEYINSFDDYLKAYSKSKLGSVYDEYKNVGKDTLDNYITDEVKAFSPNFIDRLQQNVNQSKRYLPQPIIKKGGQIEEFQNGGIVKAWIQKFANGGNVTEPNPFGGQELTQATSNYYNWGMQNSFVTPEQLNQNPFEQQMQVPVAQSNMPQNIGTNYKMSFDASNDEVNKGNAMADSMMGGKKQITNPVSMGLDIGTKSMDAAASLMSSFGKDNSKTKAFGQGASNAMKVAGTATAPFKDIPVAGKAIDAVGKTLGFFIGGSLEARRQGIENEEMDKYNKVQEYTSRNTQTIQQPSYYGQYMSKYGSNIKNLEKRLMDDIFSDFDKYMKLT